MKVKLTGKQGELQERLPDVIAVLHKMAGERLEKSDPDHVSKNPLPVLAEYDKQASAMGERIRKRLEAKMLAVLKES